MYPINQVFQYPSGKWGFVGRVDARLIYKNKDGTALTNDQASKLANSSNPGMLARVKVYETKELAIEAAKALGIEYHD